MLDIEKGKESGFLSDWYLFQFSASLKQLWKWRSQVGVTKMENVASVFLPCPMPEGLTHADGCFGRVRLGSFCTGCSLNTRAAIAFSSWETANCKVYKAQEGCSGKSITEQFFYYSQQSITSPGKERRLRGWLLSTVSQLGGTKWNDPTAPAKSRRYFFPHRA